MADLTTIREDIQSIIKDQGIASTLTRNAETTGSMGDVSAISGTSWSNIYLVIQDITNKDRQIHEMGLALPGNSKAFFYHEYSATITGTTAVTPYAGDIITDASSKQWRIEQIVGERKAEGEVTFLSTVIKRIDTD